MSYNMSTTTNVYNYYNPLKLELQNLDKINRFKSVGLYDAPRFKNIAISIDRESLGKRLKARNIPKDLLKKLLNYRAFLLLSSVFNKNPKIFYLSNFVSRKDQFLKKDDVSSFELQVRYSKAFEIEQVLDMLFNIYKVRPSFYAQNTVPTVGEVKKNGEVFVSFLIPGYLIPSVSEFCTFAIEGCSVSDIFFKVSVGINNVKGKSFTFTSIDPLQILQKK